MWQCERPSQRTEVAKRDMPDLDGSASLPRIVTQSQNANSWSLPYSADRCASVLLQYECFRFFLCCLLYHTWYILHSYGKTVFRSSGSCPFRTYRCWIFPGRRSPWVPHGRLAINRSSTCVAINASVVVPSCDMRRYNPCMMRLERNPSGLALLPKATPGIRDPVNGYPDEEIDILWDSGQPTTGLLHNYDSVDCLESKQTPRLLIADVLRGWLPMRTAKCDTRCLQWGNHCGRLPLFQSFHNLRVVISATAGNLVFLGDVHFYPRLPIETEQPRVPAQSAPRLVLLRSDARLRTSQTLTILLCVL